MIISALVLLSNLLPLLGSLSQGQSFPKQLTLEEEKTMVARMDAGDMQARNKLIEHNLRLVAHICKKYTVNGRDMEDLISIGTIGLIKAVQTFDSSKNRPLGSYASRCIENEILMSIRAEKKTRGEVALGEVIGTDKDGNQVVLSDILSTNESGVDTQAETNLAIEQLYGAIGDTLEARERMIIELRYGLYGGSCWTQREIARRLGISRSYVSRIEKRALQKLCQMLENSQKAKCEG